MTAFRQMTSVTKMLSVLCLVVVPAASFGADVTTIEGQLRTWNPITIQFHGPAAHELDSNPNPFLDYRLNVEFTGPSGRSYIVPGFFDGDGQGRLENTRNIRSQNNG